MRKLSLAILLTFSLGACGIQSIPRMVNEVEATWAEVTNQYKRRADLIPNPVKTVKAYTAHEKETLEAVIAARTSATSMKIDPQNLTPEKLQQFQKLQGNLGAALGKLMMVSERYPDLKANQNFRDLQAQLEGTENRITIARRRYIEPVKEFNNLISVPPTSFTNSLFYQHDKKPQFTVDASENVEKAPSVDS